MAISLLLAGVVGVQWWRVHTSFDPNPEQLITPADVQIYLDREGFSPPVDGSEPFLVPTGVFIQSLAFRTPNDVHVTGYVWQRYDDDLPEGLSRGVVFPESVRGDAGERTEIAYRKRGDGYELIGWHFDVALRQWFDYDDYPIDHKTVWLRLWHPDFTRRVILVPDLAAYASTEAGAIFGVDRGIVLDGWRIDETFFQYQAFGYDTDFGVHERPGARVLPELHFNIVLERQFLDPFVIHMVPLFVVVALLFGMLMTVTLDGDKAKRFGFTTLSLIGACSGLFFLVLLGHIQLRQRFTGYGIVYIESFYLLIYVLILLVAVFTFSTTHGLPRGLRFLHRNDGEIVKLAFWPLTFAALAVIALAWF
ncbi:MAG: hypothetical protein EA406_03130 [Rhodospirillales bacterium]|nr:MAG: hypothetical protein EA406_03130 [Rhodospirillales bacterium]